MKKVIGVLLFLLSGVPRVDQCSAWFEGSGLDTAARVNVSTSAPTQLVAGTQGPVDLYLWCYDTAPPISVIEFVMIKRSSSTFSTVESTGTWVFPCASTTTAKNLPGFLQPFKLEGYAGPLWALSRSTYSINVNVMRKKR